MNTPFRRELDDLQHLRRRGTSLKEMWDFLFSSPRHLQFWIQYGRKDELDLEMWKFLLEPGRQIYLLLWEQNHGSWELFELDWWNVLSFYPVDIRKEALKHLSQTDFNPEKSLSYLVKALEDEDYTIQKKSIELLGKMGKKAQKAVPILAQRLKSIQDEELLQRIFLAIQMINPSYFKNS